jgi:hypothetical protein
VTPRNTVLIRTRTVAVSLGVAAVAVGMVACGHSSKSTGQDGSSASSPSSSPTLDGPTVPGSSSTGKHGSSSKGKPSSPKSSPSTQTTKPATQITHSASFGNNVTASITKVSAITAKAKRPGEISGPAVAVSIRLVNGSNKAIDTSNAVVNLYYGKAKTPGSPMSGPPSSPFGKSVPAGKTVTVVYVFRVPADQRSKLRIEVSYSPTAPVVVFVGPAQ